jgi:tRNA(adenine34) deaminase
MHETEKETEKAAGNVDRDEEWMRLAIVQARRAGEAGEVPVGAVVVADGRMIGSGRNRQITDNDPSAHAEIVAMREAGAGRNNYRLTGATLYVTLEPCTMCAGAMVHARVDRLVFACPDPKTGAAGSLYDIPGDARLNHRIETLGGVRAEECTGLLRRFFAERR